eukprot:TRINITY_DN738_c0_g1_i1.p1 TRINITY_DN738_c0_g1~~TRINITY_DN738_c0_g1_i1.p1  ORF type:complete len:256 (+),score=-10.51 TRINITY_DN738_c0_g1_i1:124-891(+)
MRGSNQIQWEVLLLCKKIQYQVSASCLDYDQEIQCTWSKCVHKLSVFDQSKYTSHVNRTRQENQPIRQGPLAFLYQHFLQINRDPQYFFNFGIIIQGSLPNSGDIQSMQVKNTLIGPLLTFGTPSSQDSTFRLEQGLKSGASKVLDISQGNDDKVVFTFQILGEKEKANPKHIYSMPNSEFALAQEFIKVCYTTLCYSLSHLICTNRKKLYQNPKRGKKKGQTPNSSMIPRMKPKILAINSMRQLISPHETLFFT